MRKVFFVLAVFIIFVSLMCSGNTASYGATCDSINVASVEKPKRQHEIVKVGGESYLLLRCVSQYSTLFNPGQKARSNNIELARKSIRSRVLLPGEEFSFNEVVGPRTKERGFLPAPSFAGGKIVKSTGGGICQVSSTLSAAVMQLKLEVLERHRHSRKVSYISSDKEATVSWGTKDFKFKNNTRNILFIKSFVVKNKLFVELWKAKKEG